MSAVLKDKDIEISGKVIGASSIIRLNFKTAIWLISVVVALVLGILTYSYYDLKRDFQEFTDATDAKVERIHQNVHEIRIGQESIKGDIKLILDRQSRDNPINPSPGEDIEEVTPPEAGDLSYGPWENDVTYNSDNY